MKITDSMCRKYDTYKTFLAEFIKDVMQYHSAFIIVNWEDTFGVCQELNTYTINGNTIAMRCENTEKSYDDVLEQKEVNGNMLICVFDNGEMIVEKAIDNSDGYPEGVYYAEYSANDICVPMFSTVIPFKICG